MRPELLDEELLQTDGVVGLNVYQHPSSLNGQ